MASTEFLRYQRTGLRTGLLGQEVSDEEYGDGKGRVLDREFKRHWQVHVAPGE